MKNKIIDPVQSQKEIWCLVEELYPIHRTLINDGFDKSLQVIKQQLDINILAYPSGQQVWDWVIPNAWDVNEAYIEDSEGNRIVDFKDNNLHLSPYSMPYQGKVTREELFRHLKFLKEQPDAIPYNVLYYKKGWEFNVSYNSLSDFTDDEYFVSIDVNHRPGALKVGEYYLPGTSKQEILISTYLCHPSLANDNVSGVVTCVELFKHLTKLENRRYSYRLLILPETVGSITYLANNEHLLSNIIGGYTVYICGGNDCITYKKSYVSDSVIDRIAMHVLRHHRKNYEINEFFAGGSDERQYNAPGIRLPVGALTRTPKDAFYKEYHTSKDDLTIISPERLFDTVDALFKIMQTIEGNHLYVNNYKGEPFFTKHNIAYPSHHEDKDNRSRYYVKILANEFDGNNYLLDIAEKWDIPMDELSVLAKQFLAKGLVTLKEDSNLY